MKNWEKAEKKDAKAFDTTLQKGSGRVDHYPTDSFSNEYAIDSKYTDKKSYSVSLKTWNKLCEEAVQLDTKDHKNRIPLLSLHVRDTHLVVLSFEDFDRLADLAWRYEDLST